MLLFLDITADRQCSRTGGERVSFCVQLNWLGVNTFACVTAIKNRLFRLSIPVCLPENGHKTRRKKKSGSAGAKYKIYSRLSWRAPTSRSGERSSQIKQEPRWCTTPETSGRKYLKNSTLLCVRMHSDSKLVPIPLKIYNLSSVVLCLNGSFPTMRVTESLFREKFSSVTQSELRGRCRCFFLDAVVSH